MRLLPYILLIGISSCAHVHKTSESHFKKTDSVGYSNVDTASVHRKEVKKSNLVLNDFRIHIEFDTSRNRKQPFGMVDIYNESGLHFSDPDADKLNQIVNAAIPDGKDVRSLDLTIGSATQTTVEKKESDSVGSKKGSGTKLVQVKKDSQSEKTSSGWSIGLKITVWIVGVGAFIFLLIYLYKKFKDKFPLIKNLLP